MHISSFCCSNHVVHTHARIQWDMLGYRDTEQLRPEFYGDEQISRVTYNLMRTAPGGVRRARKVCD